MGGIDQSLTIIIVALAIHILCANRVPSEQCGKCHYVSWAFDANCKNLSLQVPPQECSQAKVLDLRYNNISELQENAFAEFTGLYHVDLENNHLDYIHPNAFIGNTQMSYIYLQENLLTNVANMTFTGVPNLKELYLNKNQITDLEVLAFQGLRKLDVLHISNNNLSVITFDILSNLKRLRYLYMANNHLKILQNGTFSGLENMRYLDLNFNKITIIEPDAYKGLISLHILKLAQNNIVSIGYNALMPTHHLDLLNISGNHITHISNFTHIFQILDEFYMEDNPIVCNANIKPVISWYRKFNSSDISDDPVCDKPECLKGHKVKALDFTNLLCDSEIANTLTIGPIATRPLTTSNGGDDKSNERDQSVWYKTILIYTFLIGFLLFTILVILLKFVKPELYNKLKQCLCDCGKTSDSTYNAVTAQGSSTISQNAGNDNASNPTTPNTEDTIHIQVQLLVVPADDGSHQKAPLCKAEPPICDESDESNPTTQNAEVTTQTKTINPVIPACESA